MDLYIDIKPLGRRGLQANKRKHALTKYQAYMTKNFSKDINK